ncbi:MAG: right-handed parallel beta-helix repeat-containing protein [Actinomycetota bacterium]|nr:right-handed parallel beta-helix repeat-containing protein [Actinomycetota bacterium]
MIGVGLAVASGLGSASRAAAQQPSCGATIVKDTRLRHDLMCAQGDGLVIGADGVTLDLGGHTIAGGGDSVGVEILQHDRVSVVNGTIRSFRTAVEASGMPGGGPDGEPIPPDIAIRDRIEHVRMLACGTGVAILFADRATVSESSITGCERGILILGSHETHVSDDRLTDNQVGVEIQGGGENRVLRAAFRRNSEVGLSLRSSDNTIRENSIEGSHVGIYLFSRLRNKIEQNQLAGGFDVDGNPVGGDGIFFDASSDEGAGNNHEDVVVRNSISRYNRGVVLDGPSLDNTISANQISKNRSAGVEVSGAHGNVFEQNVIVENGERIVLEDETIVVGDGIRLRGFEQDANAENLFRGNSLLRNFADGISLSGAESLGVVVERNTASRNGDDGIDIDFPGVLVKANSAHANGDLGIEAVPGTIDGGGNTAHGNGNPAQCLNVVCH